MANFGQDDENEDQQEPLDFGLSDQDKAMVGDYATNGVNYDKQAKIAALNKFMDEGKNDPTLQNMMQGMAFGGVSQVGGRAGQAIAEEAAPYVQRAGKAIADEAAPYVQRAGKAIADEAAPVMERFGITNEPVNANWAELKPAMEGTAPNASSATSDAIGMQQSIVNKLEQEYGAASSQVKHALARLNRMKFGN